MTTTRRVSPSADRDDIERMLRVLARSGEVLEMRILGLPRIRTAAGYFNDIDAA
jgi:hypothetical protein